MDFSNFNRMVEVSHDFMCCCPLWSQLCPVIMSFKKKKKNTENQPLSKTVNVFLGRLHDPKQTNKVKSHSGFSGDIGTLFKMS